MANPRVFISSTCYDLGEVRDSLVDFLESYHYEPVLSDRGDIFYHPDLHTHDSCINEIENCQILILIIGGRFGGNYKSDMKKSITNAEYNSAVKLKRPVFTFVKREVFEDHRVYQRNKDKEKVMSEIDFPSIEKSENAKPIFEFINEVRLAEVNNGFFSFEYARDIKEFLGKQFSGMMYDFLSKRIKEQEQVKINQLLDNLTLVNKKTEEIIENIYRQVGKEDASQKIDEIDQELLASKFFKEIFRYYDISKFNSTTAIQTSKIDTKDKSWIQFLDSTEDFRLAKNSLMSNTKRKIDILWRGNIGMAVGGDISDSEIERVKEYSRLYESYRTLSKDKKLKVLKAIEEK